jgi:lipoprotein-releasing system permease protein
MYKILLSWRYLRTRYIALASIVSVMLGVATMIVVNSVMSGFTTEMQERIHGILSDLVFESRDLGGFADAEWHMDQIRRIAGDQIESMTPTVVTPAMLTFDVGGEGFTFPVQLIGIDETTQGRVSDFGKYLQHPENRRQMTFHLHEEGYDVHDHQAGPEAKPRVQMRGAGWGHRRRVAEINAFRRQVFEAEQSQEADGPKDPFAAAGMAKENVFDPATQQRTGLVLGIALANYRRKVAPGEFEDRFLVLPGDDVQLTFPTAGTPPKAAWDSFTVVDFYESKMSEYDASFVFVPIHELQVLRNMIDPTSGVGLVNSIQIKLKPGADGNEVRDKIAAAFSPQLFSVSTWRDKQLALLAAVEMETAILNVLLFLIIAVAGFGILAIFLMIVVEKTRDIGVLKSLGASGWGIMGIFLSYGLSLGLVGSGVGLVLGLLFVRHINEIADFLGRVTGRPVFDPEIYYFYKIPTLVDPTTVGWIVVGALAIAVLASILPACRAARLHPVEALRYE